ncbi:MAG TPA: hypothetical protein VMY43_05160 [Methanothrix sp.]|nr:hypothetical protein [Methanothrix sp.]
MAVSDRWGGIYDPQGLLAEQVLLHKKKTGSLIDFREAKSGAENISTQNLLEMGVNVLIPAALSNQITEKNGPCIRARLVAKLANGPTYL